MKQFFMNLWNYRKNRKMNRSFDQINSKLEKAVLKKRRGQVSLENDIRKHMRKFLKVGANSKFIPLDIKSNTHIRQIIEKKYGKRMKELDVVLTNEMQLELR